MGQRLAVVLVVVLSIAAPGSAPTAGARTSLRICKLACAPRVERTCMQRPRRTRPACRKAIVRDCRKHGAGECNLSGRNSFGGEGVADFSCEFDDPDPDPRLLLDFTQASGTATFSGTVDDGGSGRYVGEGTLLDGDRWMFRGRSCDDRCCREGVLEGTSYDSNTPATWTTTIACDPPLFLDACTVRIDGRFYRFCILGVCID
jgi:hypothetical protein